jgi:hypothetical protein
MAARKRSAKKTTKRKTAKKRTSSRGKGKSGTVPLHILEKRAHYLVELVKRRGGKPKAGKLSHRTPKMVGKARRGRKIRKK